jgi:gluconolactonase
MRRALAALVGSLSLALGLPSAAGAEPAVLGPFDGRPDAIVDLGSDEGARLVRAAWRYRDANLVAADFRAAGADLRPSGMPVKTLDIAPKPGTAAFDGPGWEAIAATSLTARRGTGRFALGWYRVALTIPERVGAFDPTGSTAVFEIVVDDYAEVWVGGTLPRAVGQRGGSIVGGFNVPSRVVVARDARPGQRIEVAVLAINGPISDPPANFIWIRSATLDFYRPRPPASVGHVVRVDPALDAIVPATARVEKLATGFTFTEGPVWMPDGSLVFSDPNDNRIYRWTPDGALGVFRTKSGYAGTDIAEYRQPGSNGLALDGEGRLVMAEHGNRRITRLEKNGVLTVLVDRYDGQRLNSPNDVVVKSDGAVYFTDPPFGLPAFHDDPRRELPWSGIYRYHDGRLVLLSTDLDGPNGLAFSPDERFLYVANWDPRHKVVMRYEVAADGTLVNGRVFFDVTRAPGEEALDGLKVDRAGHVYVSGPGGVWIVSPDGTHLGTIQLPEVPANFAWGDADGRTLYLTARTGLYRIRLAIPGAPPRHARP